MVRTRLSWREKLGDDKGLPKVEEISGKMSTRWGTGTVVVPAPREVNAVMRRVPKGKVTTIDQIRRHLARQHCADVGCPITTGIFAWIAAHAAEEDALDGKKRITPYWRTLKAKGELNPKYPGGIDAQRIRLESEGHCVVQRGKRFFVSQFEKALAKL